MRRKLPVLALGLGLCAVCPQHVWGQTITAANITNQSADAKAAAVSVTLTGTLSTTGNSDFRQLRDLCYQLENLTLTSATCTDIPNNALHSRHRLKTLLLPTRVQTIGSQAFYCCDALEGTLTLPANMTSVGASAFSRCASLQGLSIPSTSKITNIGSYAFQGCTKLAGTVTLPKNLHTLRDGVFSGCSSLEGVELPASLQTIGANAFAGCSSLTGAMAFDRMVTRIGASAFAGCSALTELSMPRALQQLGEAAFFGCSSVKGGVTIPASIAEIGAAAFQGCSSLESVTLPATLTEVKAATFAGCTGLKEVKVYAANPPAADATAFAGVDCAKVKLLVPEESQDAYAKADVWKNFDIDKITAIRTATALSGVTAETADGRLWVRQLPQGAKVQVYNAKGQQIASTMAEGDTSFPLAERGVYMVKVDGKTFRVAY